MENVLIFIFIFISTILLHYLVEYAYKKRNVKSVYHHFKEYTIADLLSNTIYVIMVMGGLMLGFPIMIIIGEDLPVMVIESGIYYLFHLLFFCSLLYVVYKHIIKQVNKFTKEKWVRELMKEERDWDLVIVLFFYVLMLINENEDIFITITSCSLSIIVGRFFWIDAEDGIEDIFFSFTKTPMPMFLIWVSVAWGFIWVTVNDEYEQIIFWSCLCGCIASAIIQFFCMLPEILKDIISEMEDVDTEIGELMSEKNE